MGDEVRIYDRTPDIGGVWSATRAYPGISIQNDKRTYGFSDTPMPTAFPEFPEGADIRAWLERFAADAGIADAIELGVEVSDAEPVAGGGWRYTVTGEAGSRTETADWLVVANGIFSKPHVPAWAGREEFEAAAGLVRSPSDLGDGSVLAGKHVLVLGWGKSSWDIAARCAPAAASMTLAARRIRWKLPKRVTGIAFQRILLSRGGEHLLWAPSRTLAGRAVARLDAPLRRRYVAWLGGRIAAESRLAERGILPPTDVTDLDTRVTAGFFDALDAGRLAVLRDTAIERLTVLDGKPAVALTDGSVRPVDVVVAATGYDQDVSLFAPAARARLLDAAGDLALHRRILPTGVPRVAFVGWTLTFRSPIGAELQAAWLLALAHGQIEAPKAGSRREDLAVFRLTRERAGARGLTQLPANASILYFDDLLADLALETPLRTKLAELAGPVDPVRYRYVLPEVRYRITAAR